MRVTLEVTSGPHAGKRIVLMRGQSATFGRTPQADYQFANDLQMSGRHFSVEVQSSTCLVRDLNSRNGTFVDDKRVLERMLASGSVILAGESKFTVTIVDGASASSPNAQPIVTPVTANAAPAAPSSIGALLAAAPPIPLTTPAPSTNASPLGVTKVATPRERWRVFAPREYELALDDADPLVQRIALLAAVWKGQKWVLEYCRNAAVRPLLEHWDALHMLAILGTSDDLPHVQLAGRTTELGPHRFVFLGAFGHPQIMSDVLAGLANEDPLSRVAAAAAFTKITGEELPASDDQPPDVEFAQQFWRKLVANQPHCPRWCRGHDVGRGITPETLTLLDFQSRWEACLRGRLAGTWKTTLLDREQLAEQLYALPREISP